MRHVITFKAAQVEQGATTSQVIQTTLIIPGNERRKGYAIDSHWNA